MKQSLRSKSKLVVKAWNEFLKDPANKLPIVADAISKMEALIKQEEEAEAEKSQLKLFK